MDRPFLIRIPNIEYFWYVYTFTSGSYLSPFDVLAELEKQALFSSEYAQEILVPYTDGHHCKFTFNRFYRDGLTRSYLCYDFGGLVK
jgi:hypothetical protein